MDGRQNHISSLSRAEGQTHRFRLAHFADHQHVRILTQAVQQRLLEAGRVASHFTLANKRLARSKRKLDRVFNCNDVPGVTQVDRLNQRSQRGCFAAARRAADEHQAIRMIDKLFQVGMQVQRLQSRLECGQQANRKADAARSVHHVDAAAESFDHFGQIKRSSLQKMRPIFRRDDVARPLQGQRGRHGFADGAQLAAHAQDRRQPRFQMQVAGAFGFGQGYKRAQVHG